MAPDSQFLTESPHINFSHPAIAALVESLQGETVEEKAVTLYYRIRDGVHYNPYTFSEGNKAFFASYAATHGQAYCIPKSALMVAGCRRLGIPARLGLADVRNHMASNKLIDWLGTDLFVMHGYAELFIKQKWVKCTPVFNQDLCARFNIEPLDFDGTEDSIFHAYTKDGQKHMEYVADHGTFGDVPVEKILQAVARAYPHIDWQTHQRSSRSLEADLADQRR